MIEDYKLCYIDEHKAWFTSDYGNQWGDDWGDSPYEHNAGEPYTDCDLWSVYFEIPYTSYLPCDNYYNSPYSVEDINKQAVAWIHTKDFNILGGTTYEEFKNIILTYGGKIYEEIGDRK